MAKRKPKTIHVLFYKSAAARNRWVAHCLDYNLVGTGSSTDEAFGELLGTIEVQFEAWATTLKRRKKVAPKTEAPKKYWGAFRRGIHMPDCKIALGGWAERVGRTRRRRFPLPETCEPAVLATPIPA